MTIPAHEWENVYLTIVNDGNAYSAFKARKERVEDPASNIWLNKYAVFRLLAQHADVERKYWSSEPETRKERKACLVNIIRHWDEELFAKMVREHPESLNQIIEQEDLKCIEQVDVNNQPGESEMNPQVPFETKDYVFGQDVENMSEAQLLDAVKKVEAEIRELESVETKSKYVTNKVKDMKEALARIVEKLDTHA